MADAYISNKKKEKDLMSLEIDYNGCFETLDAHMPNRKRNVNYDKIFDIWKYS